MTDEPKSTNPKIQIVIKFVLLLVLMATYFGYLTFKYDLSTGGVVSLLTWSFFVLCTPIADAGFLLDFPPSLIFGIRMVLSEIFVGSIAIVLNIASLIYFPCYYKTTALTKIFQTILTTPYPYWIVIILSGLGTFLSIQFDDELMDVIHHRDRHLFHKHGYKHELIMMITVFVMVIIGYYALIASLDIDRMMP